MYQSWRLEVEDKCRVEEIVKLAEVNWARGKEGSKSREIACRKAGIEAIVWRGCVKCLRSCEISDQSHRQDFPGT